MTHKTRLLAGVAALVITGSGCRWLELPPPPAPTPTPIAEPQPDLATIEWQALRGEMTELRQQVVELQEQVAELLKPTPTAIPTIPVLETPQPTPTPPPTPTSVADEPRTLLEVGTETISLPGDVLFDFDKAVLRPEATALLRNVVATLQKRPNARVLVVGHTDNVGEERYNLTLSLQRATAVHEFLQQSLADDLNHRWTVTGYGASQPTADNSTNTGRQRNRRVDIIIAP
ncbi:MAG: hypothetical protein OHK0012_17680 [Synechococcales cyanobacterium]